MSNTATLEINGNKYELPLVVGTENEVAVDIKTLRSVTKGVTTIDPGYKNTGSCESAITFLNGEEGILRYRGYSIEELAEKADFLEVAYLLIFGELPNAEQLEQFHSDIRKNSHVDEDVKKIVDGFPKSAHPMGVLSSLTSVSCPGSTGPTSSAASSSCAANICALPSLSWRACLATWRVEPNTTRSSPRKCGSMS